MFGAVQSKLVDDVPRCRWCVHTLKTIWFLICMRFFLLNLANRKCIDYPLFVTCTFLRAYAIRSRSVCDFSFANENLIEGSVGMKLFLKGLFLNVVLFAGLSTVSGSTIEGPIYDSISNVNLYVVSSGSWNQAESQAVALGGHLVTIHSAAENQFIVNNVLVNFAGSGGPNLSDVPLWIGLYDPTGAGSNDGSSSGHAANFVWADGSTSTYRNWNSGEPNNAGGTEYYAAINWHYSVSSSETVGTWNDTPLGGSSGYGGNSNGTYYGIAAVPVPEPSSFALLGLGIAGFALQAYRRRNATV